MTEADVLVHLSRMVEAIPRRSSVRAYRPDAMPAEALQALADFGRRSLALIPTIPIRFEVVEDAPAFIRAHGGTLWGYGRILGAPHFLIAISETLPGYMENMGFRMEQVILFATAQGLGTCWMGGFYSRERVGEMLGIAPSEQVVALTPLGWPAEGQPLFSKAMKWAVPGRAHRRPLAELVFAGRWGEPAEVVLASRPLLRELLEAARLAPSWRNSQPWRFLIHDDYLYVAAIRPREQIGLPYYRLDAGIAMSHIHLGALHAGLSPRWELQEEGWAAARPALGLPSDADVLARLHLAGEC